MTDHPDLDHAIAETAKKCEQLQTRYDAIKYSGDSCSIIDIKVSLTAAERQLRELRSAKEADRPVESVRSSAVFFSSNS
jgi:hypothetical protein